VEILLSVVVSGLVAIVHGGSVNERITLIIPNESCSHDESSGAQVQGHCHSAFLTWTDAASGEETTEPLEGVELVLVPSQRGWGDVSRKAPGCARQAAARGPLHAPSSKAQAFGTDWTVEMECLGRGVGKIRQELLKSPQGTTLASRFALRGMKMTIETDKFAAGVSGNVEYVEFKAPSPSSRRHVSQLVASEVRITVRVKIEEGEELELQARSFATGATLWTAKPLHKPHGYASIRVSNDVHGECQPGGCLDMTRAHFARFYDMASTPLPGDSRPELTLQGIPDWLGLVTSTSEGLGSGRPICMSAAFEE
jgi:hypothetical protein